MDGIDGNLKGLNIRLVIDKPHHPFVSYLGSHLIIDSSDDVGGDGLRVVRHSLA